MKQRICKFGVALIALVLCFVLPVSAGRIDFNAVLCVGEIVDFQPERSWVPVGCEVVDCCPGCPGPGLIDWRIRLTGGPLLEGVVLQFENLRPETISQLGIKGTGKWEGSSLQVGKGETFISGFRTDSPDAPPVAIPRLLINRESLRKLKESEAAAYATRPQANAKPGDVSDAAKIEVTIEQLRGEYVINEARFAYSFTGCPPLQVQGDRIDLDNNTSDDRTVILLDARNGAGTCEDDEIWRGVDDINVASVLSNGACNSEVAVFSDDNAMKFITPVNIWTDPMVDRLRVVLAPILEAPVSVWLATGGTLARAQGDIANANLLYNANNVGISFNATFQDLSSRADAVTLIGTGCTNAGLIQPSAFFTPNRLNVYYVNSAFTGVNCTGANPNIQFVGTTANNQTLAHEFGHSFSLVPIAGGHTNGLAGFDTTNIMQGGGAGRTHFSEGQAFRMNLNNTSTINVNGVRTGPVRNPDCAPLTTSNICPRLALNAAPK